MTLPRSIASISRTASTITAPLTQGSSGPIPGTRSQSNDAMTRAQKAADPATQYQQVAPLLKLDPLTPYLSPDLHLTSTSDGD